jgi:hypothetical protein
LARRPGIARVRLAGLLAAAAAAAAPFAGTRADRADASAKLSDEERLESLRRARVWRPVKTESLDLEAGPRGPGAFAADAHVQCEYVPDAEAGRLTGSSPKFRCRLAPDDVVKVKYGEGNGEVFAEVAATRLFWALGFGADRVYPVRVACLGCPIEPFYWRDHRLERSDFEFATIERKLEGVPIESDAHAGWSWDELELLDPKKGGAPREHVDALKLLAVFVQHGDNKPDQQRLVCPPDGLAKGGDGRGPCRAPLLVVQDLGATFGGAGNLSASKWDFADWSGKPVWRDAEQCIGELNGSLRGTLQHPRIGEAGRRFLAAQLARLSDAQIRDLFAGARADGLRQEVTLPSGERRRVGVDDWAAVFKRKRDEIARRRCPS